MYICGARMVGRIRQSDPVTKVTVLHALETGSDLYRKF